MADSNVKITVSAEDKATPTLNKVNEAFKQYKASYESIGQFTARQKSDTDALAASQQKLAQSANQAAVSNKSLFTSFAAGSLAAAGIQKALSFAVNETQASIQAAQQYQAAMSGLASAAGAFGQNIQATQQAAKNASSDGLVPLTSNVEALKNLLQSGLSLEQAIPLMQRFKDEAAFGRAKTIDYGTAVENLSQAFKTEQSMLGNLSGHSENFSVAVERGADALGKNVSQLSEAERLQAKYNGYLQAGAYATGNAAQYAETAAGKQAMLNYQVQQAQIAFGSALQPAVSLVNQAFVDFMQSVGLTQGNMQNAQGTFITLAAVVAQAANIIVGAARVIVGGVQSIASLSFDPLKNALKETADQAIKISVNWQQGLANAGQTASDTAVSQAQKTYDGISDAASKATKKMNEDIERENRNFTDSMEKRAGQFKESMTDMIIAHRDKSRSIQADLNSENAAYAEQVTQRQEDLQTDLSDLEERHASKVTDITKQISDEKKKGILVDGVLYSNANQDRLTELQQNLADEDLENQKAQAKRQAQYDKDVAADAKKHLDKITQLQTSLNEETAILQTHAAEVAAVGEQQKEDDISRLKRQFAEANVEAQKQHQQRLIDIRQQGLEQGATYGASMAEAFKAVQAAQTPSITAASADQGKQSADALRRGFLDSLKSLPGDIADWIEKNTGAISGAKAIGDAVLKSIPGVGQIYSLGKALHLFADGGVISRPTLMTDMATGQPYGVMGEAGPEAIVPMNKMQKSSGGPTIYIGQVTNNVPFDWTAQLRNFAIELR